jgi:hypothetical protein
MDSKKNYPAMTTKQQTASHEMIVKKTSINHPWQIHNIMEQNIQP